MKKRWFWIVMAVVIAVGFGVWLHKPATPPTVRTMVVSPAQVEQTITCNGVVEAADGVGVFAPVDCFIRDVCVVEGQRVKKGDVLAVIDKEATYEKNGDMATQILLAGMTEELTAPEDGIVVEVSAEVGKKLSVGTPCALLVRPCDLRIRIAVREKDLRVVREGMGVRMGGDGLARTAYRGTLSELSSTASVSSSATVVEGIVDLAEGEVDDSFRLGLSAKVTVITSVTEAGYVIPYEAVLADEEGSYVYVLENDVAHRRSVEGAVQISHGWLLTDANFADLTIVLEPDRVPGDGAAVTGVAS